jgi:hypothetical protein
MTSGRQASLSRLPRKPGICEILKAWWTGALDEEAEVDQPNLFH